MGSVKFHDMIIKFDIKVEVSVFPRKSINFTQESYKKAERLSRIVQKCQSGHRMTLVFISRTVVPLQQ